MLFHWMGFMFSVYVLKSQRNGKRYIGCTGKRPEDRLREHNQGTNKYTKANVPYALKYTESFTSKTDALKREKFLKSGQGRKFLDNII